MQERPIRSFQDQLNRRRQWQKFLWWPTSVFIICLVVFLSLGPAPDTVAVVALASVVGALVVLATVPRLRCTVCRVRVDSVLGR